MTNDVQELETLAKRFASQAKGNEQIEVYVSQGSDVEISIYKQEVENMTTANSTAVGIRVIDDHREGSAWAESLDEDILVQTLASARENASIAEPDEYAAMVSQNDIDGEPSIDRNGWDESIFSLTLKEKIDMAIELDAKAKAYDKRINDVPSSDYEDGWGHSVVANSNGIVVSNSATSASISTSLMLGEGESLESNGFSFGRGIKTLNMDEAIEMAFTRGVRLLNGTQPISQALPIVLDPLVATQYLGIISSMLSGGAVAKGRALFGSRIGEKIGNSSLNLIDDPTNENAFTSSTHDSEGLPTRENVFFENGVLQQFAHTLYSARRLKMKPNACAKRSGVASRPTSGMRAFRALPTGESVEEIFQRIGEGLYVQHFLGVHSGVNALSGDFSVGAQGVWIRNGHFAESFKEATIASDLPSMLANTSAVANDTWWLPGSTVGNTILIDQMVMTGK
ncbi:MAG: TldD/PmbA family protein [Acidimicrobiia bacterium]